MKSWVDIDDRHAIAVEPCPWCGGKGSFDEMETGPWHPVICEHCGASGPKFGTRAEAVLAWNAIARPRSMRPSTIKDAVEGKGR